MIMVIAALTVPPRRAPGISSSTRSPGPARPARQRYALGCATSESTSSPRAHRNFSGSRHNLPDHATAVLISTRDGVFDEKVKNTHFLDNEFAGPARTTSRAQTTIRGPRGHTLIVHRADLVGVVVAAVSRLVWLPRIDGRTKSPGWRTGVPHPEPRDRRGDGRWWHADGRTSDGVSGDILPTRDERPDAARSEVPRGDRTARGGSSSPHP